MTQDDQTANVGLDSNQSLSWENNTALIQEYFKRLPVYEQLCSEVAYTLKTQIKKRGLHIAGITSRAKTLESFLEKLDRKSYEQPFNNVTDFAGVRVICYYPDSLPIIESIIYNEFEVIQKEDKTQSAGVDRFGYGGTHLLVKLGSKVSGARYDDLKGVQCEIQVRTVMQDAWAVLSHHLTYKKEKDIPNILKRRVNALAGALDTADFSFQAIRDERDEYLITVKDSQLRNELENIQINVDSLREYLSKKYPNMVYSPPEKPDSTSFAVTMLLDNGFKNISELDMLLDSTYSAREFLTQEYKKLFPLESAIAQVLRSLAIKYKSIRDEHMSDTAAEYRNAYAKAAEKMN